MNKNISISVLSILSLILTTQITLAQSIKELMEQGDKALEAGRYPQAEVIWQKVLRSQPGNAYAYRKLGDALSKQKKFDEAIAAYRQAIQINPK